MVYMAETGNFDYKKYDHLDIKDKKERLEYVILNHEYSYDPMIDKEKYVDGFVLADMVIEKMNKDHDLDYNKNKPEKLNDFIQVTLNNDIELVELTCLGVVTFYEDERGAMQVIDIVGRKHAELKREKYKEFIKNNYYAYENKEIDKDLSYQSYIKHVRDDVVKKWLNKYKDIDLENIQNNPNISQEDKEYIRSLYSKENSDYKYFTKTVIEPLAGTNFFNSVKRYTDNKNHDNNNTFRERTLSDLIIETISDLGECCIPKGVFKTKF